MHEYAINFSSPSERAIILRAFNKLVGPWAVIIKRIGRLRTSAQNRLYWSVYVDALVRFMSDQGTPVSNKFVHLGFKFMFLRHHAVNLKTGESFEATRSTTDLTTAEFNDYLDKVQAYLSHSFHIVLPTIGEFVDDQPVRVSRVAQRALPAGAKHANH